MFSYRAELDGLRAIAVLSVLFFHAGAGFFSGGYVGVDVFFVLSGFLITSIILNEMKNNTFSFSKFYERRIRRLAPPLIPVLLISWLIAFTLFDSSQLHDTTKSLYSTLAISANWYFYSSVGYFDGPGELTPLLHMWSLSIEEQFYLIFPLLLLLTLKLRRSAFALCALLFIPSFAYSVSLIFNEQIDLAFYGSLGRFWELLVGAILACIPYKPRSRLTADTLEITGVAMVIGSILWFTSETKFPGFTALIPTMGTALIIAASGNGRIITPILQSKPLVWIGLISYGLYLWHWPLLVLARSINPSTPPLLMSIAVLAAFLLATFSYYYLEQPIRQKQAFTRKDEIYKYFIGTSLALILIVSSAYTSTVKDLQNTISANIKSFFYDEAKAETLAILETEKAYYHENLNLNFTGGSDDYSKSGHAGFTCSFDRGNTPERVLFCLEQQAKNNNILVIGDSIGRDTLHALRRSYPSVSFIMLHHSGCPPAETFNKNSVPVCFPKMYSTLRKLSEKTVISGVILSFRYRPKHWISVKDSIPIIKELTPNVTMLGVAPMFSRTLENHIKALPPSERLPLSIELNDKDMIPWNYFELASQAQSLAKQEEIKFANISSFFCTSSACRLWIDNSYKKPIFWDNQHITDAAMTKYGEFLTSVPELRETIEKASIE